MAKLERTYRRQMSRLRRKKQKMLVRKTLHNSKNKRAAAPKGSKVCAVWWVCVYPGTFCVPFHAQLFSLSLSSHPSFLALLSTSVCSRPLSCVMLFFFFSCTRSLTHTRTHSHSHTLSLSHTLTHTTHTHIHASLYFFLCVCVCSDDVAGRSSYEERYAWHAER
jgi:hypothetical protein